MLLYNEQNAVTEKQMKTKLLKHFVRIEL